DWDCLCISVSLYRQFPWLSEDTSAAPFVREQHDSFPRIPSMSFSIACLVCLLLKDRFCSILVRIHITFLIRSQQGTAALANPSKNSGRSVPLTRWTNDCSLIAARR